MLRKKKTRGKAWEEVRTFKIKNQLTFNKIELMHGVYQNIKIQFHITCQQQTHKIRNHLINFYWNVKSDIRKANDSLSTEFNFVKRNALSVALTKSTRLQRSTKFSTQHTIFYDPPKKRRWSIAPRAFAIAPVEHAKIKVWPVFTQWYRSFIMRKRRSIIYARFRGVLQTVFSPA